MKILRDEKGQALVMTALTLAILLGVVALATDVGVMLRQRRVAQTVADSAAIAAATESLYEGTPSSVSTGMWAAASDDAAMNGATPGSSSGTASVSGVTLNVNVNSNITIPGYNSAGNVQAIVSLNTPTTFLGVFGFPTMNVTATSIASNTISSNGCVNVQNPGNLADPAVTMGGSSAVLGINCGVTVNGDVSMGGSSNIDAKFVAASGTISTGGSSGVTGSEGQNVPLTPDPLARLQLAANQPTLSGSTCTAPSGSGMSCLYNQPLTGTLQSNTIYYFDGKVGTTCGGATCVTISGSVTGSNVTLYFAGNTIPFDFASTGTITLTPPGYGASCKGSANPLCGILFDAPTDGSSGGTYTCSHGKGGNIGNPGEMYFDFGSSTTDLEGVVYAPYMQMFVQDQGASTTLDNDVVIGNLCSQAATLTVNGYSAANSPVTRVGLVY